MSQAPDQTQMDDANRAMCYALRNPPGGSKPLKLSSIRKLVRKRNGKKPTLAAISLAARTFKDTSFDQFEIAFDLLLSCMSSGASEFLLFCVLVFSVFLPFLNSGIRQFLNLQILVFMHSRFYEILLCRVLEILNSSY